MLRSIFPEHWELILSLAYFQSMGRKPLSKVEPWTKVHDHPYGQFIDHRRITVESRRGCRRISKQLVFFKQWAEHRLKEECLAYDITSISSYSELNNMIRFGYNRDEEITMRLASNTSIVRYTKIRATAGPYNRVFSEYFKERTLRNKTRCCRTARKRS